MVLNSDINNKLTIWLFWNILDHMPSNVVRNNAIKESLNQFLNRFFEVNCSKELII